MSTFPVLDYATENAARLEKMSKDFGATLPKDMMAAVSLMSHPAMAAATLTAVGFGLAGQAFGMWAGAVAGAAEASQRLFMPPAPKAHAPSSASGQSTVAAFARAKPALKVVAKTEPASKGVAESEPASKVVAESVPEPKVALKAQPAAKPVAKAEPAKKPAAALPVEATPVAATMEAPALMPEDFHKPRAMERPAAPDDLKAISGIGPKLEKVLNDLGVWTYAQVAAWRKEEVAWVDDYLAFSGRIGRDRWIEQAATLAKELAASAGKKN